MKEVITVGLDIAKHVFQVHGIDQKGDTVLRRPSIHVLLQPLRVN